MSKETINEKVGKKTLSLIRVLENESSESRRILSFLRRTDGRLENSSDIWGFIYRNEEEDELSLNEPGYQSVLTAIKFYAIHQRARAKPNVFKSEGGLSIGEFLAKYRISSKGENIDPKVSAILISKDYARTARLLESLFKRSVKDVPSGIDYANFARQLYSLNFPDSQKRIMSDWGKKYYQKSSIKTTTTTKEK